MKVIEGAHKMQTQLGGQAGLKAYHDTKTALKAAQGKNRSFAAVESALKNYNVDVLKTTEGFLIRNTTNNNEFKI